MACETCDEQIKGKCNGDINSDCVYLDKELPNSGVSKNTLLTTALIRLDSYIQELKTTIKSVKFLNIGLGSKLYKGRNNQGEHEIRTITSDNNSVQIEEREDTINLSVEQQDIEILDATETQKGIAEIATQDEVEEGLDDSRIVTPLKLKNVLEDLQMDYELELQGDTLRLLLEGQEKSSVQFTFPDSVVPTDFSNNGTELVITLSDNSELSLDIGSLLNFQQEQADLTEEDSTSPSYIQNRNPSKSVFANYTLTPSDNNYVIVVDSNNPVTITVPNNLPNNHTTGFIQKGTGLVTIANTNIIPEGLTNTIKGRGHQAFVEKIEGTTFLFGNLNRS